MFFGRSAVALELDHIAAPEALWSEQAHKLSRLLHLGTSTWAFPGWKGIVYKREYRSKKQFMQESLAEYATIPWFRTVCIDNLFYNPPKREVLEMYASQTPATFQWVSKVWERITIIKYPKHARYGSNAGADNPDLFNLDLFKDAVLRAYDSNDVQQRTGPFVFQFAPFSRSVMPYERFIDGLADFLSRLPRGFMYAVEVRNPEILTPDYFAALREARVTHCFNQWNTMISLREQMKRAAESGGLTADFYVARLLTPPRISYEAAEKLFEPYDRVQQVNREMRRDIVRLARRALTTGKKAFVTANNKAEGNSAITMLSIAQLILNQGEFYRDE